MNIVKGDNNLVEQISYTKEDKKKLRRMDVIEWIKENESNVEKLVDKITDSIQRGDIEGFPEGTLDSSTIRKAIYEKNRKMSDKVFRAINKVMKGNNSSLLDRINNKGKKESIIKTITLNDISNIDKVEYYDKMDKHNVKDRFYKYLDKKTEQYELETEYYDKQEEKTYKRIFIDLIIGYNRDLLIELQKNINILKDISRQRQCLVLYIQLRELWEKNIDLIQYIDNVECWDGYYENLEEMKNYKPFEKSNVELLDEVVEQLYQKIYLGIGDTEADKIIEIYLECDEEDIINIYKLINLYRNDVDRYESLCNIVESILNYEK